MNPELNQRREGRRLALQLLYALDAGQTWEQLEQQLPLCLHSFADELGAEAHSFAMALAGDAGRRRQELDAQLQRASTNWRLERMSCVDRSILRLAAAELSSAAGAPVGVVLNEAIELAKEFGGPDSPAFVNGVLNHLAELFRAPHR